MSVNAVGSVPVEISIVLGHSTMPVNQLLRMGRGAVIELTTLQDEQVSILANNIPIAYGKVNVEGETITISISKKLQTDTSRR
jgi:flagellar motor switch protein FliN/FliY